MDWLELLLPIVQDIVITVVIILVGMAVNYWKNLKLDATVKELIEEGVLFAQEKYWDLRGEQRFGAAKEFILNSLNERGINVSMEWLDGMIDATVKRLREEYETWYKEE